MPAQFYRAFRALLLVSAFFVPCTAQAASALAARQFADLLAAQWAWQKTEFPERATFRDERRLNDRLTDLSFAAIAARKQHQRELLARLNHIDASQLSGQDAISHAVLQSQLQIDSKIDAVFGTLPFGALDAWMPLSQMNGVHLDFPALVKATAFTSAADYDMYLKRLAALPLQLGQTIAVMESGIASGWMPPAVAIRAIPGQIAAQVPEDPAQSMLFQPFASFPDAVGEDERARLRAAGLALLRDTVRPAFANLKTFVQERYLPAARKDLGASTLPGGAAYYGLMIRRNTTTDLDAHAIHALGLREVARINLEMDAVMRRSGFKGARAEFQTFINTDAQFKFTRAEDLLAKYRDIAKRADAELPRLFAELPRLPYGIRAMQAYEGDNAEHYTRGASDGSRAGYFEANTNNLHKTASYGMEALVMHEAVPGHHLQIARQQELKDLPEFRKAGSFTAYTEGWALYAESLGDEMGFYTDPYSKFGQLAGEMWRACRLVMDTGIHAFGWTREQAIRYKEENAAAPHADAVAETDRYIVWPGQALGYKIGELRIKSLRAKAQAALGQKFDVRRFHNAVLDNGALPLDVLDGQIDLWIARERDIKAR